MKSFTFDKKKTTAGDRIFIFYFMPNKRLGTGAICSVWTRFLHPKDKVAAWNLNITNKSRVEKLLCSGRGRKVINKVEKDVILFRHDDYDDNELYAVPRYTRCDKEEPESFILTDLLSKAN